MTTVLAYLEPGSGSMLLQVVVVAIAAAAVGLSAYWRRVRGSKLSRYGAAPRRSRRRGLSIR